MSSEGLAIALDTNMHFVAQHDARAKDSVQFDPLLSPQHVLLDIEQHETRLLAADYTTAHSALESDLTIPQTTPKEDPFIRGRAVTLSKHRHVNSVAETNGNIDRVREYAL